IHGGKVHRCSCGGIISFTLPGLPSWDCLAVAGNLRVEAALLRKAFAPFTIPSPAKGVRAAAVGTAACPKTPLVSPRSARAAIASGSTPASGETAEAAVDSNVEAGRF